MANDLWYAFKAMSVEDQKEYIRELRKSGVNDVQIQQRFELHKASWDMWKTKHGMWVNGRPGKKMKKKTKSENALCWVCKKACGRCSWSNSLTPVEGWTAIETDAPTWVATLSKLVPTVRVVECPEFIEG